MKVKGYIDVCYSFKGLCSNVLLIFHDQEDKSSKTSSHKLYYSTNSRYEIPTIRPHNRKPYSTILKPVIRRTRARNVHRVKATVAKRTSRRFFDGFAHGLQL